MNEPGPLAVLVDDMFFAAKISGAAQTKGKQIKRFKSIEQLVGDALESRPSLVIIDLSSDRFDPIEVVQIAKSAPSLDGVPVVGFLSHVQVDLIRRAGEAGCDYVVPRSAFARVLPEIVVGNLGSIRRAE